MLTFARINRNLRSLKRYRQILGVLIKYGFGHVIEQLNIDYYLELGKRIVSLGTMSKKVERFTQAERLRMAMEELGPTFIKLGQILSTRPDLVPSEYTDEFRKLQDRVPPLSAQLIRQEIEQQLGVSIAEAFAEFEDKSIAAGSIAQIHRARLHDGRQVAIKVRRPGIMPLLETDLDILAGLAYLLEHHMPGMDIFDPSGIVREFRRILFREIDLTREAHTIERFAANFSEMAEVFTPKISWQHSCETILTMEYVEGVKITDAKGLDKHGLTGKALASLMAKAILQQILVHGLFHGDPHPGNIFVLDDGRICFLDFGMVGRLDAELKHQLSDLIVAIIDRDTERLITQLIYSGDISDEIDRRQLKRELNELIDDYYELSLAELNTAKLVSEFIDLLNRHRIHFPADLILLAKALVTIEGVARDLDPDFVLMKQLQPQIEHMIQSRYSPNVATREMLAVGREYSALFRHLPKDLRELLMRINRNKFKIDLEHRGLQKFITDLDRSSNRISFSVIIASLVIGSSLVMQTDKGPMLFDFPLIGLLGYSIAGFLGLGLAIAILRSGRM
jgi:ubiquinone biosynthesis protein